MKIFAGLMVISLVGCATSGQLPHESQAISYQQLERYVSKLSNKDCGSIDYHINYLESQLQLRGLANAIPEKLNEDNRKYNLQARVGIWGLRIGCNNPNRYSKL